MEIKVWNPDKGEDYNFEDFKTKQAFSSLSEGLFVVEATGVDWNEKNYRTCLYSLLNDTLAKNLTVIITPWGKEKSFKDKLDKLLSVEYSLSNYISQCDNDEILFEKILDARTELGGNESGEWFFIGSNREQKLEEEEIIGGFSKVLDRAAEFEFLIFMAEMQQTFLVFKPFDNVNLLLGEIEKISG